ncbi:MAG: helix-turn-helix transcriptional regulator [Ktedonobacteraceae bacterium]
MVKLLIKDIAEKQGLNRSQLQRVSGVTLPMLYRYWDNNTESVHLMSMERIAKALGVQVRDLFAADEPQKEEVHA